MHTRDTVPVETLTAVRQAGYSDQQIADTLRVVVAITFTNHFNRINDTVLDFPAVA